MPEEAMPIAEEIRKAVSADEIDLPTLPEVALRIRNEAESETATASSLALVISDDPAITAQVVRIANSPMFRATRAIDDLQSAVSRLGVQYCANIVTGLAMQQMFQATSELVDNKLREVWRTATETAAWSSILTKRYTRLRPDQSTLAGLTHSIGVLPILSWVEEHDVIRDSMTLDRLIEQAHPGIGSMILRSWEFSHDLVAVPEQHQRLDRESQAVDYADVVGAARMLRNAESNSAFASFGWSQTPTFDRLGLTDNLDEDVQSEIKAEVDEVSGAF
ncbi:MAG: HDOD domain-containing protein [Pseudomonadota bacterium]